MNLNTSQANGKVPVTILQVEGQLDGQNYQQLIEKVHALVKEGAKNIVLDISDLTYISSAGLVGLHTSALILNGEAVPDSENGWANVKSLDRGRSTGKQQYLKILNPRPEVQGIFDMVGFSLMFDIFYDRKEAIESFL